MSAPTQITAFAALLLSGAIFGFFYAWVCSTMWGLDALDPRLAIPAMQEMNASVRNAVFAPAFFGTPFVLALAALLAWHDGGTAAAMAFGAAALVYGLGGMVLTVLVNVPMNQALAQQVVPDDIETARAIWQDYSPRWQMFNMIRTGFSGLALLLCGWGLMRLG